MDEEIDQRAIDKAHAALAFAERTVAVCTEAAERIEAKIVGLQEALENAKAARVEAAQALADAEAEQAIRSADPLLVYSSFKGNALEVTAEPAEGEGA